MKLLAALTLAACFTILPSCVTAEEIWNKGDKVAVFFICKEEKDIMNGKKITSLCVHSKNKKNRTIGFIHIHNILNANIN